MVTLEAAQDQPGLSRRELGLGDHTVEILVLDDLDGEEAGEA